MRTAKSLPSQEELRNLFDYDPNTGSFTRKVSFSNAHKAGAEAGTINNCGYKKIFVQGEYYYASRLIWCWVTGEDPGEIVIDHKNKNRSDNRWINLRKATPEQNTRNSSDWQHKASGLPRGVAKCGKRYKATLEYSGKRYHLGVFDTPREAHDAYKHAKLNLHGDFAGLV